MDQGARFPAVAEKAGHYESFYVKACRPGGGQGVWIRHTVHKRPGQEPTASIWFTWFDREAEGPRATKVTVPAGELSTPPGSWIRVGAAEIGPGYARASAVPLPSLEGETNSGSDGDVSWELEFDASGEPCEYLPAEWLYRAPVPKTKFVAPVPDTRFSGRLELGGETIELDGWPGMIGHNWGSEHAERWVWLEGTGFENRSDVWFDSGAARVGLGPWTTPWIAAGMLSLEGERHRLGGFGRIGDTEIEARPGVCSFVLPGKDIVVRGRFEAPEKDFVGWVYADPDGPEHNTINCSVCDLELTVERPAQPAIELTLAAGGAFELGMRETDHGIPIQPYPDG
jgi:hypothetical protein